MEDWEWAAGYVRFNLLVSVWMIAFWGFVYLVGPLAPVILSSLVRVDAPISQGAEMLETP